MTYLGLVAALVRVVLDCQFPVRLLDLVVRGVFFNAQLIVKFLIVNLLGWATSAAAHTRETFIFIV
jgi:hypothetical protein